MIREGGVFEADSPEEQDLTVGEAVAVAKVKFGAPGRCPSCGEPGFLDYIDARVGMSESSCRSCRIHWSFNKAPDGSAFLVNN